MAIQWNAVTWYSKLLAVLVFIATFYLAFTLGILWEQTHIETAIIQSGIPAQGDTTTQPPSGTVGSTTPSDGTFIPRDMLTVTAEDQNTTVHLSKNERFAIRFGELSWTLAFTPANGITRVANSISTDGYQGVYEADQTGTVTLVAEGRPICKPGEMCAQFIQAITITFVIGS